jgi:frataxin-like iron-binding protein CyaY
MDGLLKFIHANAMPPIRQIWITSAILGRDRHATHTQNGWSYAIPARDHHATHTPKWTDQ